MLRLACCFSVVMFVLFPALPLLSSSGDGKDKDDPLIAAMKFVKVPKGEFWMGWESMKKQSKQVEIKANFELAAYTVTQEQWETIIGKNPSAFSRQGQFKDKVKDIADADLKRFPVEMVSWNDVQEFLKKLNAREQGRGWSYRLPSEAEWEYACRGGATSKEECSFDFYYLDKPTNDLSSKDANFYGSSPGGNGAEGPYLGRPAKVGLYKPNKLVLHDMHGNVLQWCSDKYVAADWTLNGGLKVIRGGCWSLHGMFSQAGYRRGLDAWMRADYIGFRLARVPAGDK
jgi:formylglycine-generating enzyme required for sulfatase activity